MQVYGNAAEVYRDFAADADSDCFTQWATGVADDAAVLAWLQDLPEIKRQPNLVFAAARWHGVPAPGPYAGFREALLADGEHGPIRATILARFTQTNEAGRLATLLPALTQVAEGRPVALLEVGASAGLCLYPDRWRYAYETDAGAVAVGAGAGPLPCVVTGAAPLPCAPPDVAWRGGLDLTPIDVADPDRTGWLETLIFPEHEDRRTRLREAIEIARAEPSDLRAGDLLTDLPPLLAQAGRHAPVIVFHTAVIAYLTEPDRRRFAQMMADLVADGACHWVSNEGERVLPEVSADLPEGREPLQQFVLGVDGRAVARTHGHGRSMTWFSRPVTPTRR